MFQGLPNCGDNFVSVFKAREIRRKKGLSLCTRVWPRIWSERGMLLVRSVLNCGAMIFARRLAT